ncbi:ion transporter [Dolosigranulum pigrum]|uniref:ion transporter n=1 Tax=Dolosigranulum pigrum TaxID=29394 RepID=UPI000DBF8F0F|nr:ion transporter [Dolosigranulum pigrum]RAN63646.1 hypothetical protein B8A45_08900 [Dolosigranulum pigrum]
MKLSILRIIDVEDHTSQVSKIYNIMNIIVILLSTLPLLFKNQPTWLILIDRIAVSLFIIEYGLHLWTADLKFSEKSKLTARLYYLITPAGLIDLFSILPSLTILNHGFRLFRIYRLVRSFRIFRIFKIFRHSRSTDLLINTVKRQKKPLSFVFWLTIIYIFISSTIVFNAEPETFSSYIDALHWAIGGLTTATYGDVFPKTIVGQVLSMLSYLVGVMIIALPSSIITAGYIEELERHKKQHKNYRP